MFLIIFLAASSMTFAYSPQEGNITATIAPYFFKTNFKDAKTTEHSPLTTGIGLIVNGDISTKGALEIGLFHMNKRFLRSEGQKDIIESSQVIHVTMGYKWWLSEYLSTSLTLFSAYPLGTKRILYSNFPKGSEIPTSARDTTEYGFDLALQSQITKGKDYDVVAELRYSLSATSRDHEESDHYGVLVGLRYLIQEKNPDKKPDKQKFD